MVIVFEGQIIKVQLLLNGQDSQGISRKVNVFWHQCQSNDKKSQPHVFSCIREPWIFLFSSWSHKLPARTCLFSELTGISYIPLDGRNPYLCIRAPCPMQSPQTIVYPRNTKLIFPQNLKAQKTKDTDSQMKHGQFKTQQQSKCSLFTHVLFLINVCPAFSVPQAENRHEGNTCPAVYSNCAMATWYQDHTYASVYTNTTHLSFQGAFRAYRMCMHRISWCLPDAQCFFWNTTMKILTFSRYG